MNQDPEIALDLHDIQGNIVKAYNRLNYSRARYVLFEITNGEHGRDFIRKLVPKVTMAAPWSRDDAVRADNVKPEVTLNVAITFAGLERLGLPQASLLTFPQEFVSGMHARREILGDDLGSDPKKWDPAWKNPQRVHILATLNGPAEDKLIPEDKDPLKLAFEDLLSTAGKAGSGVQCLSGHLGPRGSKLDYQPAAALYVDGKRVPKEHFGYTDGISNPYFKGSDTHPAAVVGGGKVTHEPPDTMAGWAPLETGEFLLGYKDEAFEYPEAPMPPLLARNGTYLVFRKLHENVGSFNRYIDETGPRFEGGKEALAAKFVGRWRNGAPLASYPTEGEANEVMLEYKRAEENVKAAKGKSPAAIAEFSKAKATLVAFDYDRDLTGSGCPVGAHTRRMNPRGGLEFGRTDAFATRGALTNRRRILRRGLPYGKVEDPTRDDGDHGIVIMILGASIRRQFEFVQQQWMNYGNDFKLGNDKDPILGNHGDGSKEKPFGRMVIEAEPDSSKPPFLCSGLPRFVETRGGEYFFLPSLTALRMIGDGIVDPT